MNAQPDTQWYYDYFNDVDTMNIERLAPWMNDDIVVRFGNQPVIRGKTIALAAIEGFWKGFKSLRHQHGEVVSRGNYTSGEAAVTFTLHDGRAVTIPGVTILEMQNGRISRLGAYLDFGPLYAPPGSGDQVTEPAFFIKAR